MNFDKFVDEFEVDVFLLLFVKDVVDLELLFLVVG